MTHAILGKLTRQPQGYLVKLERVFQHPIKKVWDALTKTEILRIWFTDIEMEFSVRGKMTIWFKDAARTATSGEILEIKPPNRFVFMWEDELAEWDLFELGKNSCRLVLTYSKVPEEYAASVPGGFHVLLDQLETVLDGRTEPYPFGGEEKNVESEKIQKMYKEAIYKEFPELDNSNPIIVEKVYNAPIEKVWKAITDKDEMRKWYFDLSEFRAEPGFEFQFYGEGHKGDRYLHVCKVIEVIAGKRIAYTWRYDKYEGNSLVIFELFNEENKTRVKLTHKGVESFKANGPDFAVESFTQGWTELIGVLLKNHVENTNN